MGKFNKQMFESMKEARGLDFLTRNMTVEVAGERGKVVGSYMHNLLVRFDGKKHDTNCHPFWRVKYYADNGDLVKEYND